MAAQAHCYRRQRLRYRRSANRIILYSNKQPSWSFVIINVPPRTVYYITLLPSAPSFRDHGILPLTIDVLVLLYR